jgi:hypothetical protein
MSLQASVYPANNDMDCLETKKCVRPPYTERSPTYSPLALLLDPLRIFQMLQVKHAIIQVLYQLGI